MTRFSQILCLEYRRLW